MPFVIKQLRGIVDARHWFIGMVAKDFGSELQAIDRDLEVELAR